MIVITERDRAVWRAAITLAHNALVHASDRIRDDDGPIDQLDLLDRQMSRLKEWLDIDDSIADELSAVLAEIGEKP